MTKSNFIKDVKKTAIQIIEENEDWLQVKFSLTAYAEAFCKIGYENKIDCSYFENTFTVFN